MKAKTYKTVNIKGLCKIINSDRALPLESLAGIFEEGDYKYLKMNTLKQKKYVHKNILIDVLVNIKHSICFINNIWINYRLIIYQKCIHCIDI